MGNLKMRDEHYQALKDAIDRIPDLEVYRFSYWINNMSPERFWWDCWSYVTREGEGGLGYGFCKELYTYLDDSHIDSALRRIVGDYN